MASGSLLGLNIGPGGNHMGGKQRNCDGGGGDCGPDAAKRRKSEEFWKSLPGAENVALLFGEAEFEEFIKQHKSVLVMFYAPWCGYCKRMKPAYAEAAALMEMAGVNGRLAAVDCTLNRELASKYGIRGYPTLKHFLDGQEAEERYSSGRDSESIVNFMSAQEESAPPDPKEAEEEGWSAVPEDVAVLNAGNLDEFIASNEYAFVLFYAPWCKFCKKLKPAFFEAASKVKLFRPEMKIGAIDASGNRKLSREFGFRAYPTMKLFINGGGGEEGEGRGITYFGGRSADELIEYLKTVKPE